MVDANEHYKILSIIASCEDVEQLQNCNAWVKKLCKNDEMMYGNFLNAIVCRKYRLEQEFNTRKALARGQSVEAYTEGRQKFYTKVYRGH